MQMAGGNNMNPHVSSMQRDDPICMLKGNFINFKRLYQAGAFYSFLHEFWKEAKNEEWASQLDIYKYKLARFQAWSLTKWTWFLNSNQDYLKDYIFHSSGSCQRSTPVSCKPHCTALHWSDQTPLAPCIRGSYSWGFSLQHTSHNSWLRWSSEHCTSLCLLHGSSSSRIVSLTSSSLIWFDTTRADSNRTRGNGFKPLKGAGLD